jgi:hypothetical protein
MQSSGFQFGGARPGFFDDAAKVCRRPGRALPCSLTFGPIPSVQASLLKPFLLCQAENFLKLYQHPSQVNGDWGTLARTGGQTLWQQRKGATWWGSRANDVFSVPSQYKPKQQVPQPQQRSACVGGKPQKAKAELFPAAALGAAAAESSAAALQKLLDGSPTRAVLDGAADRDGSTVRNERSPCACPGSCCRRQACVW